MTQIGFTPVFDQVVQDLGCTTAIIYGRIVRYQRAEDGICYASVSTLAEGLNLSDSTVRRHLRVLEKAELIEDIGVSEYGTHKYRTATPMVLSWYGVSKRLTPPVKMTAPPSQNDRQLNKLNKQVNKPNQEGKFPSSQWLIAIRDVCGVNIKIGSVRGQAINRATELHNAGYTPQQLYKLFGKGGAWYKNSYKGKQGTRPTMWDIVNTIANIDQQPVHDKTELDKLWEEALGK